MSSQPRAANPVRRLFAFAERERRYVLAELTQVKGLMPLLMKRRNRGKWTPADLAEIRAKLSRLGSLERKRRLADGFTTSLSKGEVRQLVIALPSVLMERSRRQGTPLVSRVTEDDKMEMSEKARMLIDSVNLMADRVKTLRATGREWEDDRGKLLQKDLGIEFC